MHRRPGRTALTAAALLGAAGLTVGLLGAAAPATTPPPGPIPLAGYIARLDAARQAAEADASHPSAQAMGSLRQSLGLPVEVQVDATVVRIPPDPYLAGLQGTKGDDFLHAADHLAALEDGAKGGLAVQLAGKDRIDAALSSAYAGISSRPSLTSRIRHDLWVFILSIWHAIAHAAHGTGDLFLVLAGLVVAAVIVFILSRFRGVVPESGASGAFGRRHRDKPVDWEKVAIEALARGDFEAAVRARYNALLGVLSARGAIPRVLSLTAGECRRAVARNLPDAYPAVERATAVFESVAYGRAPAGQGEAEALAEATESVRALRSGRAVEAA